MKVIVDENIPFVEEYFGSYGELIRKSGRTLRRQDVLSADMLILRSVTKINRELLQDTAVKFVGSVSTGIDHMDTAWMNEAGVAWAAAEGANAIGVVEYVVSVVAALQERSILKTKGMRAAVVGVGRIGSQVVSALTLLGFDVVQCDPLRALNEKDFVGVSLDQLKDLDFITFHTPLTREGLYPTYHMVNKKFIQQQSKNCVLLNAGRGAVIDFSYLKEYGEQLYWCLDVWEHEPTIDFEVLELAAIATPHIAGYTVQSKYRSIDMIYQAALQQNLLLEKVLPAKVLPQIHLSFNNAKVTWRDVVLKVYDPRKTTEEMQFALVENGSDQTFDALRNHFQERYEFAYVTVEDAILDPESETILRGLGFQ
ncbi:MAG: 4-phosphoerythronate dehydrogenase [Gammaproteobacteria bacterium]|nr:4-phosphoerythronate dehydrogenase [Gammaproteobacteria bacterium]